MNSTSGHGGDATTRASENGALQALTFLLGDEEYAIDILRVQEIKGYSASTPIPNAPSFMKGMMNVRGTVVPVIGLRERFGMAPIPYDKFTVVVLVTVGAKLVGVVVDAVSDVLDLAPKDIDAPPDLGTRVDTSFMMGMAKTAERLVFILDVEKVVGDAFGAPVSDDDSTARAVGNER